MVNTLGWPNCLCRNDTVQIQADSTKPAITPVKKTREFSLFFKLLFKNCSNRKER
jgi:hypothetical protein